MNEEIRILKIGTCPSLSGKSTLTYHICCKGKDICFHLVENSGGGMFAKDWISLEQVEVFLASQEQPTTSSSLNALFKGKSINSGGFLLAILRHEGLMENTEGQKRGYVRSDPTAFMTAIQALMTAKKDKPKKELV